LRLPLERTQRVGLRVESLATRRRSSGPSTVIVFERLEDDDLLAEGRG
jgi:hypothetical protein